MPEPKNFDEFVADAPKLKEAGIIPFAIGGDGNGWQIKGAVDQLMLYKLGIEKRDKMYGDKDVDIAAGDGVKQVLTELKELKKFTDDGYANRNWNDTTNLVITGKAGLQIMGDWARGEFSAAGMTGVKDFGCMIGLDEDHPIVSTDGDVIVFPKLNDPDKEAAQKRLAALLISPAVQVAFNNAKGSMPVRGDVDMSTADPCMQKALQAVEDPTKIASGVQRFITEDTSNQLNALITQVPGPTTRCRLRTPRRSGWRSSRTPSDIGATEAPRLAALPFMALMLDGDLAQERVSQMSFVLEDACHGRVAVAH